MAQFKSGPCFFLPVSTQFENVGDALIHRELIRIANDHGPTFVEISRCPPQFRKTLDIDDLENVRTIDGRGAFYRQMVRSRLAGARLIYLLKPGAYLGPSGQSATRSTLLLGMLKAIRAFGCRLMHFGASYERLDQANSEFLARRSHLLDGHYVRDERSLAYARARGFSVDGVLPDLAFNLFDGDRTPPRPDSSGMHLAMSFRIGQYPDQEAVLVAAIRQILTHAAASATGIASLRLVAQVSWDVAFLRQTEAMAADEFGIAAEFVDGSSDIATCEKAYDGCDLLVSNRLHALLIAASRGCPILACIDPASNTKIAGMFESAGWGDRLFHLSRDLGELPERVEAARGRACDGIGMHRRLVMGFETAIA